MCERDRGQLALSLWQFGQSGTVCKRGRQAGFSSHILSPNRLVHRLDAPRWEAGDGVGRVGLACRHALLREHWDLDLLPRDQQGGSKDARVARQDHWVAFSRAACLCDEPASFERINCQMEARAGKSAIATRSAIALCLGSIDAPSLHFGRLKWARPVAALALGPPRDSCGAIE